MNLIWRHHFVRVSFNQPRHLGPFEWYPMIIISSSSQVAEVAVDLHTLHEARDLVDVVMCGLGSMVSLDTRGNAVRIWHHILPPSLVGRLLVDWLRPEHLFPFLLQLACLVSHLVVAWLYIGTRLPISAWIWMHFHRIDVLDFLDIAGLWLPGLNDQGWLARLRLKMRNQLGGGLLFRLTIFLHCCELLPGWAQSLHKLWLFSFYLNDLPPLLLQLGHAQLLAAARLLTVDRQVVKKSIVIINHRHLSCNEGTLWLNIDVIFLEEIMIGAQKR